MKRRTFEIISKYISESNQARIVFDVKGDGGYVNMKTNEIHLPDSIGEKNVFAVLALLMHESAHIKYSKLAMEKCTEGANEIIKDIFNCVEDVRIDKKNFCKLNNVKSFYNRLLKDHCDYSANDDQNIEFQQKVLISAIMRLEGFDKYGFHKDPAVHECLNELPIEYAMNLCICAIEKKSWDIAKQKLHEIKDLLKLAEQKKQQKSGQQTQNQQGAGNPLDGIEKLLKPDSIFSDSGDKLDGPSTQYTDDLALEEQTISQFKELLNIKERKIVENGTVLNTSNLIAYFTNEIDELFKDESYVKTKKSKILFLLDGSGSMEDPLFDKKKKYQVMIKCVSSLTKILKEVQETEGLNIDWDIARFARSFEMLPKENWWNVYRASGGTELSKAFDCALNCLDKDYTVDGKKIIIVLTDGEVNKEQIIEMKRNIIHHNTDIKALIIGIGTNPTSSMAIEIIGDNLILAEDNANEVLLDTIKSLL